MDPERVVPGRCSSKRRAPGASLTRVALAGLAVAGLGLGATGCMMGHHHDDDVIVNDYAYYANIDTGQHLTTELGYGAGLFVEYDGGGLWRLWTSCDTTVSHHGCSFDVFVTAGSLIDGVGATDVELSDRIDYGGRDLTFHADTDYDYDEVSFYTDAGADLQVEVMLDGYVEPDFIFWHGDGYVHTGAPYSPVVFTPSVP
ncbi:MAG: hypothetical protein HY908_25850 [Myxococcales bacterium]|nr:hypothetical protein [Myxococcales bacterium]